MKGYYDLPNFVQWILAIILMVLGFGIIIPLALKPYSIFLLPIFAPFLNYVGAPFFKKIGHYKYLNPFVISTVQTAKKYDLHNVSTFDYLVNFKWSDRGEYAKKTLLVHYLKALLTIIDRIENRQLSPKVKIVGHSYFFNDRTAEKLGFSVSDASVFWKLNSIFQFIELTYLYSFSKGKWSIPKFWKVRRAEITGSELVTKKEFLEGLVTKISSKLNS